MYTVYPEIVIMTIDNQIMGCSIFRQTHMLKFVVTPLPQKTYLLSTFTGIHGMFLHIFVALISRLLWEIFVPWFLFWYHTYTKV